MNSKLLSSLGVIIVFGLLLLVSNSFTSSTKELPAGTELFDIDNNPVNFSSFAGKVVFINNWASWCPPCVAEIPSIQNLRNTLEDQNIVFVMVSYDEDHEKAIAFMKKKGYNFDVYFPGDRYPYFTESIPTSYLLNKEGKVVQHHAGMRDYSKEDMLINVKALLE
jgi:thiol-disulfide isomerase/thioredoxin